MAEATVTFTKRVPLADYEYEEVVISYPFDPDVEMVQDVALNIRQIAYDTLAKKIKARIDAEPVTKAATPPAEEPKVEAPKKTRGRPKKVEEPKVEDPFADDVPTDLDEQLDTAVAKDADPETDEDFDFDDDVVVRKAENGEVRAVLTNVARTIGREAAENILAKFGKKRLVECQDINENGEIVVAAEKALADAAKKAGK